CRAGAAPRPTPDRGRKRLPTRHSIFRFRIPKRSYRKASLTLDDVSSGIQCVQLSDRLGVAARQRHHRHGVQILWLWCGGGAGRGGVSQRGWLFWMDWRVLPPAKSIAGGKSELQTIAIKSYLDSLTLDSLTTWP